MSSLRIHFVSLTPFKTPHYLVELSEVAVGGARCVQIVEFVNAIFLYHIKPAFLPLSGSSMQGKYSLFASPNTVLVAVVIRGLAAGCVSQVLDAQQCCSRGVCVLWGQGSAV
jgi:hypothetical protein